MDDKRSTKIDEGDKRLAAKIDDLDKRLDMAQRLAVLEAKTRKEWAIRIRWAVQLVQTALQLYGKDFSPGTLTAMYCAQIQEILGKRDEFYQNEFEYVFGIRQFRLAL